MTKQYDILFGHFLFHISQYHGLNMNDRDIDLYIAEWTVHAV